MSNSDALSGPTPPACSSSLDSGYPAATAVKLCLLVVFNHRYEGNLPKLAWLYRDRFEHVRYLMPFYRGNHPDVIPVYYSSFQFQGFFMEAWKRLRDEGFTHFLFVADDMVLNPSLSDRNFLQALRIHPRYGYFKQLTSLANRSLNWFPTASGLVAVAGTNGVNWQDELPSFEVAKNNLEAKGYPLSRLGWHNFHQGPRLKGFFQFLFFLVLRILKRRHDRKLDLLGLPYPLLSGNADLLMVPAEWMDKFCYYCSVFAAMGLFVEIAAPTALVLACPHVVCEPETGGWVAHDYFLGLAGPEDVEGFYRRYDYDLEKLLDGFEERTLCLHPIKLSRWRYPGAAI